MHKMARTAEWSGKFCGVLGSASRGQGQRSTSSV